MSRVPPSAGFFGKAALLDAGVQAGSVAVVALLFVGGGLTFVYLFQVYQHTRWRPVPPEERPRYSPPGARSVVAVAAVVVFLLGVWPEPLLALSEQAGDVLVRATP